MSHCGHDIHVEPVIATTDRSWFRWHCSCGARQFRTSPTRAEARRAGVLHQRRECPDPAHAEELARIRESRP